MIKIENLDVSYGNKKVITDLSVAFEKGSFTAIVGPNGCGKSTLIKTIARIVKKDQGHIYVDEKDIEHHHRKELARKIAFLMQFKNLNNDFTIKDIVAYGRMPYLKKFHNLSKDDYEIIDWALKVTNLTEYQDKPIDSLSGGEAQRVHLALALAQQPEVLVLDEPTNHLDIKYQHELLTLVKKLNLKKKITIICVLHDLNHAIRFADKIMVMKDGKVVAYDEVLKVIDKDLFHNVYGVKCHIFENNGKHYFDIV